MDFLFGADMPACRAVLPRIRHRARADRRHRLPRSPFRRRAGSAASASRGRQPRLAVIDAAAVDGRRRLVLIRRDNVEHLLMIGGPTDVVVEPNIVRAAAPAREAPPPRPPAAPTDTLPRAVPLGEGNMWPLQPAPSLRRCLRHPRRVRTVSRRWWKSRCSGIPSRNRRPCRPCRRGGTSRAWSRVSRGPSRAQPIRSRASLPNCRAIRCRSLRRLRRAARRPARERDFGRLREPERARSARRRRRRLRPRPHRPSKNRRRANADQNLAEMAQRLEAALRRPKAPEPRAPERAHEPAPSTRPMESRACAGA